VRNAVGASVALVMLLGASPALAATAEGGTTWLGLPVWVWAWGNLLVFWGIVARYAGPPVRDFFVQRKLKIRDQLQQAAAQRREAAEMRATLTAKLAELQAEVERLRADSELQGRRESEQILAQAARERERIVQQTGAEIEQRTKRARQELVRLSADLAADLARERIERTITPEDRHRLVHRGLELMREKAS
jgi:F-type H+-transporting ATPase subunit b